MTADPSAAGRAWSTDGSCLWRKFPAANVWEAINSLPSHPGHCAAGRSARILQDRASPVTLYVNDASHVYRSRDAGDQIKKEYAEAMAKG